MKPDLTLLPLFAAVPLRLTDLPTLFLVMAGFLVVLLGIGLAFRSFNSDTSDYFRAGGKATWWLVGGSIFMGQFSAWTFTGAAGAAYQAGWSLMVQFAANVLGFAIQGLFAAGWYRQLREITAADLVRLRFGSWLERFVAGTGMFIGPLFGAVQLYSLAIFVAALFRVEIAVVIAVLGVVILFYVVVSGAWAVLAADFIQCLIVLPITVLMAILSLRLIGGWSQLFAAIEAAGLQTAFTPIKSGEAATSLAGTAAAQFTWGFFAGWYLNQFLNFTSINYMAGRYLSAKDGREARRGAWLAAAMMAAGMVLWFIPSIVARLTLAAEVSSMALPNPAEGAYAAMAMHLLPPALVGVVLVAMCAATMSSLDASLTAQAAQITQNIYPALCRWFGWRELTGAARLNLGRTVNFGCAVTVILLALAMARFGRGGVFQIMMDLIALLMAPVGVPLCLALFVRRATARAALVSMVTGWVVSAGIRFGPGLLGTAPWSYQGQIFALASAGAAAFLVATWLAPVPDAAERARTDEFFGRLRRPVDFAREVGAASDNRQLTIVGAFGLTLGGGMLLLLLPASSAGHSHSILSVALSTLAVGGVLWWLGRKRPEVLRLRDEAAPK